MNETHTPGPWTYSEGDGEIFSATSRLVAQLSEGGSADGRLIAAAPELLATTRFAREWLAALSIGYPANGIEPLIAMIDSSIAKAEGR